MTHRSIHSRPPFSVLILAIAASAITLGGCSKNDEAKEAVDTASLEFGKISIGDSTLSENLANAAYTKSAAATAGVAGDDGPYGEAAAVSLSLSNLGLATLAGSKASETETEAIHQSRIIRGHLSEWIAMNAVALASSNFDTADDKKALQGLIKLRADDVVQYTELLESLQSEIQNYRTQIADLDAKSVSERNESARFELQMTSVTATKAALLAERVREHSLRADGFELESVRLQGRVGQLLPGAHEIELQAKKANDQIDLLNLSIKELDQRARDSKQDSAQARANAEQAQSMLTKLVSTLEEYRSVTANPANQKVISLIRKSLAASGGVNKNAKVSGTIAKATGQEHLARAISRQSRGEAEMVSLYQSILSAGVPGNWQSQIDSHSATLQELTAESQQAFQDAASALRSTRARGAQGESIEAAAVRLDRLGGIEPEPEYTEEYESDFDDSEYEDVMDDGIDVDEEDFDEED